MKPHDYMFIAAQPIGPDGYGPPAFNIDNTEQGLPIVDAALSTNRARKEHANG